MTAADYQLDYNGTIIGDGTPWDVVSWAGLEQFTTRGTDVVLSTGWGAIPGSSYVDPKVVALTVQSVNPVDILVLEAVLLPPANASPSDLVPIRWKFPNREELISYGRCARRSRARDVAASLGQTSFTFEIEIPDPRCYAASALSSSLTVFTAGTSGFDLTAGSGVNLGFDLTLASGADLGFDMVGISASGLATLFNSGTVDTYPTFTFSTAIGMSSWVVTNQTTGQVFTVNQTLNVGSTFVANMQAAATGSPGLPMSIGGSSVYGSWQPPRSPFRLVPGANVVRFETPDDPNAACLVSWQSAYL